MAVPFILLLIGFTLMHVRIKNLSFILRVTIVGMILLSVWCGFILGSFHGILGSGLGGKHGLYLSEWLKAFAGMLGTALILLTATTIWMLFANRNTIGWLRRLFTFKPSMKDLNKANNTVEGQSKPEVNIPENTGDLVFETEFNRHERSGAGSITAVPESEDEDVELVIDTHEDNKNTGEENPEVYEMLEDYDPTLDLSQFRMPVLDLLEKHDTANSTVTNEELISNKNKIVETLSHYKIQIDKIKATIGPTVTLYEIVPAPGVRISKIKSLEDDIALSLAALGIRIIAPMPGKGTIGIEVPNQNPEIVSMRSVLS